jgi:predicted outer membrane protein
MGRGQEVAHMTKSMATKLLIALIAALGLVWSAFAQAPQLNAVDKAFADAAASNGLAEIQLAKLAAGRASHQAVREFAGRLEADHTKANLELRKIVVNTEFWSNILRTYSRVSRQASRDSSDQPLPN